ncbi:MAG: radical SAM protein, partial [Actinobacteria bacterium]|nr:radical SAM protein [Actinomycetota bacterium]
MSLYASWKNRAAMAAVSGGLTGMKFMPDSFLTAFGQWCLREMPYPEGREFLTTILLLAKRHLDRMSPAVQSSVPDFIANALVKGDMKRSRFKEEMGFDPPVLMVISPTMRCNLNCYGCYAGKYANKNDLGIGTLERLLFEVEEMGVYFITISGGEPFVLGDDLLRIMERHPSILFQVYTNGTLIDRDV